VKFGTNQPKSAKTPSIFFNSTDIAGDFQPCTVSVTGKACSERHHCISTCMINDFQATSRRFQVAIHTKFAFSRLEQYGFAFIINNKQSYS
jgi:hypothetical protein